MRLGLGANGPVGFLRRTVPWPLLGVVEGCREAGLTPGGGALIVSAEWAESLVVLWQRRYVCIECRCDGGIKSWGVGGVDSKYDFQRGEKMARGM